MFSRWLFLAWLVCVAAHAQDTQFLPQVDGYLKMNSSIRAYVQAKDDREGGDSEQFTFGPSFESQYSKWSATGLYAGSLFPVGRHVQFDLYYEHENDTGKSPTGRITMWVWLCISISYAQTVRSLRCIIDVPAHRNGSKEDRGQS